MVGQRLVEEERASTQEHKCSEQKEQGGEGRRLSVMEGVNPGKEVKNLAPTIA
jgi:hypothetical protein